MDLCKPLNAVKCRRSEKRTAAASKEDGHEKRSVDLNFHRSMKCIDNGPKLPHWSLHAGINSLRPLTSGLARPAYVKPAIASRTRKRSRKSLAKAAVDDTATLRKLLFVRPCWLCVSSFHASLACVYHAARARLIRPTGMRYRC